MVRESRVDLDKDSHLLCGYLHHLGDVLDAEEHPPRRLGTTGSEAQQVHMPDQLLPVYLVEVLDIE